MSLVKELYEPYVLPARARISTDPLMRKLVDPAISPELLERFFLQYHALGVYMTEPHAGWLRRSGQRWAKRRFSAMSAGSVIIRPWKRRRAP